MLSRIRNICYTLLMFFVVCETGCSSESASRNEIIPLTSKQVILVLTESWSSLKADIYLFENNNSKWKLQDKKIKGVIGKKGLAWGLGIHDETLMVENKDLFKKEGDRKTPAGIFYLGKAMGYAKEKVSGSSLDYSQMTKKHHGVDDPESKFYNKIVNVTKIKKDYNSYEKMLRNDDLYKRLFEIKHNEKNLRGMGSLIFFHIWRSQNKGTAGCTAVSEKDIIKILKWLDQKKNPVIIQLPRSVYQKLSLKKDLLYQ